MLKFWRLRMKFRFSTVSCQRKLSAQLVKGTQEDGPFWDFSLGGIFQDWEVTKFQRLLDLRQKQCEPTDRPDGLTWELGNSSSFSVKSYYEKRLVRAEVSFPCASVWTSKMSRKLCCFTWLATRGVISRAEHLNKQKVVCVSWCFLCRRSVRMWTIFCYVANQL